jgi:hypothetical protein
MEPQFDFENVFARMRRRRAKIEPHDSKERFEGLATSSSPRAPGRSYSPSRDSPTSLTSQTKRSSMRCPPDRSPC